MKTRTIPMSEICVSTRLYERRYNKMPKGRGSWAFSIGTTEAYDDISKAYFTNSMTYREAVKVAKKEAQRTCSTIVYVLP